MGDGLRRILRRADRELIEAWGKTHSVEWPAVPDTDNRTRWLAAVYPDLALNQQSARAHLSSEAGAIASLGQSSRDWIFRDVLNSFPDIDPNTLTSLSSEGRALWLWLNKRDAFEWAHRRQEVFDKTGKRRLCNRYSCSPDPNFSITDTELGPFIDSLSVLYKKHDFSGEHVIPNIDWELDSDHRPRAVSIHASVSRLSSLEETIDDAGKLEDLLLRRPTNWRCRFELQTGRLDLICDRGGPKLRNASADAFVEHVLRQTEPPVAIEAPPIDLLSFVDPSALPMVDGLSEWRVTEVVLVHGDNPDEIYSISSSTNAWEAATRLTQEPVGELGAFIVQQIKLDAIFSQGTGATKRAEREISAELFDDGRMTFKQTGNRQQIIKSALEDVLESLE